MSEHLLERGLFAAMAAVLIVPELATFFVLLGCACGLVFFAGRFAWALLYDPDKHALPDQPTTLPAE